MVGTAAMLPKKNIALVAHDHMERRFKSIEQSLDLLNQTLKTGNLFCASSPTRSGAAKAKAI